MYKDKGSRYKGQWRPKGEMVTSRLEDFRESFTSLELNLKRRMSYFHSFIRNLFSLYCVLGGFPRWRSG